MKIYLAGPDVFRPDVDAWAASARLRCEAGGHQALIPLDGNETQAQAIFRNNLRLIDEADVVIANLNPFRGDEPDSGTCVEVGYALARGKRVIGYVDCTDPLRIRLAGIGPDVDGRYVDANGWSLENFNLPLNLMLAVPVRLVNGGLSDCLALLVD